MPSCSLRAVWIPYQYTRYRGDGYKLQEVSIILHTCSQPSSTYIPSTCASHAPVSLNCPSHQLHSFSFSPPTQAAVSHLSLESLHPLPSAHVPHTKCPAAECSSRRRGQVGTCCSTSAVIVGAVPAKCQASALGWCRSAFMCHSCSIGI